MKVMIVEDSPEMVSRMLRLLQEASGLEIAGVASSNAEAIALFDEIRPQVVTLDITLRDGNSLDSLRRMMAAEPPPTVIVVTDHALAGYREHFLDAGATSVIAKSDLPHLPELIRTLLEGC